MIDQYQRNIDYMRISITDRCNLRCRYCMPEDIPLMPMENILRYEEILQVCEEAVRLGIRKYKITGGEPLVRQGCIDLIRRLKALEGVDQVTLTTNGLLLSDYLESLRGYGIDGINISLDTLDPARYRAITGFDKLEPVMEALKRAVDLDMKIKINAVLQEGINEKDWEDLLELARYMPVDVRFIELMPIGMGRGMKPVSNVLLLDRIREKYPGLTRDADTHGNGPAVYYRIPGFSGSLGLISALHGKFCSSCNRIRLTSTGDLKPCLCYQESIPLRQLLREGRREEIRELLIRAVESKPLMHHFEDDRAVTEQKKMAQIGG